MKNRRKIFLIGLLVLLSAAMGINLSLAGEAPYRVSESDAVIVQDADSVTYSSVLKITGHDDLLLNTAKGAFKWNPDASPDELEKLKSNAASLSGKQALVVFKASGQEFAFVMNIELPAGGKAETLNMDLSSKLPSGQSLIAGIFDSLKKKDDIVRVFTAGKMKGIKPEVTVYIQFEINSAEVKDQKSIAQLEEAGKALSSEELKGMKFIIAGHTDSTGDEKYNLKLSMARAQAVKDFIVKKYKVDPSVLETRGFGEQRPVASNDTPEGRAKNRRVVFSLNE